MSDPLKKYYPTWIRNCEESVRWLRSGAEYEEWHASRNLVPLTPEEREEKAIVYLRQAEIYKSKLSK